MRPSNTAGQQQWVARYNGPGNADDEARAIAVDTLGNVYVTGSSAGVDGDSDYATIKYNAAGQQQWVARYGASGPAFNEKAVALVIDSLGQPLRDGCFRDGQVQLRGAATVGFQLRWWRGYSDGD